MKVIITIPAYNESKTLGKVLQTIKEEMSLTKYNYSLQVVDDGSTDATQTVAKAAGAKVFRHPRNYGLAETFRTEMQKALEQKADIIVHTDADGQYRAKDIPRLIKAVEDGNDLVLGNRFWGGVEGMPPLKEIGNKAFSRSISKILGTKIGDCQTGFRAFTKQVAKDITIVSDHTYTQEQIIKAVRQKFTVTEIPTPFLKRPGRSRLIKHPFEYATRAWINILRIQRDYNPLKFFGKIGMAFLAAGILLGLALTINFITTGKVGHLPATVLTMLLTLTGLQVIMFGFLADKR